MIKIWLSGIALCLLGYIALTQKVFNFGRENENFGKLLDKIKEDKKATEDTSLGSGLPIVVILCPFINMIIGITMLGIVIIEPMWQYFLDFMFDKF